MLTWPQSWCLARRAARRRALGRYDRETLALWHAAAASGGAGCLFGLAAFRRDLGRPLPQRWVTPLCESLGGLDAARRRRAMGLLAEACPTALSAVPSVWLDEAARALPGVAQCLGQPTGLADWGAFTAWQADQRRQGGHCLVGNAGVLAGRALGPRIDAHAAVWRFNRWQGRAAASDQGQRCDVWVISPEVHDAPIPPQLRWAVLSGPDPRFQLSRWDLARRLTAAGVSVLTIPLPTWRTCVERLHAPPSAGVLSLAWLHALGGGAWDGVRAVGIGHGATGPYHLSDPTARAGARHAWSLESQWVRDWAQQGLGTL